MSLVVVEAVNDEIDDESWRGFCSSIIDSGCSKIIIISRVDTISRLGTTQALKLKRLRQHEFWYFFRALYLWKFKFRRASGANTNPQEDCNADQRCFPSCKHESSGIFSFLSVVSIHGTFPVIAAITILSDHTDGPFHLCNSGYKTISGYSVKDGLRKITADDVLNKTSAFYEGNFEFLRWRSPIPPITAT
uniref:NB-ARC domain-containing protein n=1 Tax=Oryza rufipogon TaxID=4529 RepID=A0A0E0MYH6_ORYRU